MYNSSTKRRVRTPIVVGMLVAAGAITAVVIIIASNALKQPAPPENPYPSIEIEMPRTTYQVGERLDFAIHTYGICATPNVTIWRYEGDEGVIAYQYMASPFRCPPPAGPDQPHMIWKADQLVQRINDENSGGSGDSIIATSTAINLIKAGNYTINVSIPDQSKSESMDFIVMDATN
jgi:hypothetical protein